VIQESLTGLDPVSRLQGRAEGQNIALEQGWRFDEKPPALELFLIDKDCF
jgi:hypothetical protein